MLNILKSDFYKLKKSRTFWICALMCVLISVFLVAAIRQYLILGNPRVSEQELADMREESSAIWALEYLLTMGFHLIISGAFTAVFISSEFRYGTMKNALSRGAARIKIFFSKFAVCSIASLVMLFAFMLTLLAAGTVAWGFGTAELPGLISMMALQSLMVLAYTALFAFISMNLRSNGAAIAVNIICVTMVSLLFFVISMLFGDTIILSDYWLEEAVSILATTTPAPGDVIRGILIALGWGTASLTVGTVLFKKRDVK
jgi:ABC-2 type transport system permease protein